MRKPAVRGGGPAKRCPECGVELKTGVKYCDFCGAKVAEPVTVPTSAGGRPGGPLVVALKGLVVGCLAVGLLAYIGNQVRRPEPRAAAPSSAADDKRLAAASCENFLKRQARGPFRVIALRSTLVSGDQGRYEVSGVVDLQSNTGVVQQRRYFCSVHPDAGAGMRVDEGKMY